VTLAPKGLLIEEQRTNLLTYSAQFDNAGWTKSNATIDANVSAAPDGTTTADLVKPTTTGLDRFIRQVPTVSNGASYVSTVYAKANGIGFIYFADINNAFNNVWFNLTNGTTSTPSVGTASMTSVGNGWWRCVQTTTASSTTGTFFVALADTSGSRTSTASGNNGVLLWGAQLEAGAFATSYIPTVASQVTRAADSASMIGNNFARWYTQGVGTLFAQASSVFPASGNFVASIADSGSSANLIALTMTSGNPSVLINANGSLQTLTSIGSITLQQNVAFKISATYKTNYAYLAANGVSSPLISTLIVPTIVSQLNIGVNAVGGQRINGTIARLAFYPRAFAATEQQGITS
jgi:hypothetical protein